MKLQTLCIHTKAFYDVRDLTPDVERFVQECGAKEGLLNIFTRHTTVAIKINEWEEGILRDLKQVLYQDLVKLRRPYFHNNTHIRDPKTICPVSGGNDCLNGHSHISQMLLGSTSETIPVQNGKMLLGTWQRILMFELDYGREREVILSFMGETQDL